ncbi:HAD family phosphatase [Tepidiforma sp.]|uniref:HAD family hydrolase n=1 Tax=Tepidiforma sp. TaxID=2682230 RepID=UPI00260BD1B7|nr:HAD family phosphatase [Tepidiforma sp.]MCX7618763.1 HAD family phosphatase [Tepidiforma sp.]
MTLAGFAAVIFDMDGVLVDGEPLHFRAVNELLAEEGLSISLEAYKPYMGTKTGWQDMARDLGLRRPLDEYAARYRELMLEKYRTHAAPLPGARELVTSLANAGVPLAVASSSIRPWVEACLERIGLLDAFDVIVTGSEVREGKPHPEIYLLTAHRLEAPARGCLAFEDAPAGILSARAAGMTVWAVRTEYTRGLPLPDPDREFESLTQVDLGSLIGAAA